MRGRDRLTVLAAAVAIAAGVLVIGGAPRWSLAVIAVPTLVAVGSQLTSRRGLERKAPLLVLLGLAFGMTLAQAIPLPASIQASANPVGHQLIEEGRVLMGDPAPKVMALSVDPPATRRAALELLLAVAVAWVLLRIATSQKGRYTILITIAGVCGLAAAIGAIDQLLGASSLYGLYTPHHATPTILGPLLNPNSYGSLLVMGAMVAAGLALHTPQPSPLRAAWLVDALLCLVIAFATLSRGALVAAGIGAVTTAAVWLSGRRRHDRRERKKPQLMRVTMPVAVVVVCGLALLVLTSASDVTKQLENTSVTTEYNDPLSKYAAWRSSTQLVQESPWVGIGRGAFEASFTRLHPESSFGTFAHLENEYLQAVVDWGIPGAAALAMSAAWLVLVASRRRRDGPLAAGALGGLAAVAAQSTVDFGLELPGLLIPAVAVAATVTYVPLSELRSQDLRRAWAARAAMLAAIVVLVVLVVLPSGATLAEDHDALLADEPPTIEVARDAMRRHPLDYYAPAHAALALFAVGDASAIKHLNRALVLHPTLADLHRLAARVLAANQHASQAKLEYQIAMRYTYDPVKLVGEILATFPSTDDAVGALWLEFPQPDRLADHLRAWKREDVALRYLRALVDYRHKEHQTVDVDLLDLLVRVAIDLGDLDAAETAARERLARDGGLTSRYALAKILRKRDKAADAETVLAGKELHGPPNELRAAQILLCDLKSDQKKWADAEECLHKILESSTLPVPMAREIHSRLSLIAEQRGDKHRAQMERAFVQGLSK